MRFSLHPLLVVALALGAVGLTAWLLGRERDAEGSAKTPSKPGHSDDPIDRASEDSFPASDSPAWSPVTGTGAPR